VKSEDVSRETSDVRLHGSACVEAIVLDIEGTTTPMAFVYEVLFPFARRRLRAYLLDPENRDALREPLRQLREEWTADSDVSRNGGPLDYSARAHPADPDPASVATYVEWLMDVDRKSPGLKLLQGQIWDAGYRGGELKGEVFPDVPPALRRWRDASLAAAIYSSGSELAQRRLFGSTASGDLTPLIARFFDTAVGAKQAAESYRRIARELERAPDRVLFISDVTTELDAARSAGCHVLLCVRPGNRPQPKHDYRVIQSFGDIDESLNTVRPEHGTC
jgi:enolase-phosphatase E1